MAEEEKSIKMAAGAGSTTTGSGFTSSSTSTADRMARWQSRWKEGNINFHLTEVNQALVENLDKLTEGQLESHFLLPLCGKSVDIAWLYQLGYRVTGVEGVEQAIQEFFREQNLAFSVERVDAVDGSVYKSLDGRLRMYHCDFFKFANSTANLGQFDCVFDRGSLVALYKQDRPLYSKIMKLVLKSGFRYLLQTVDYDWVDPPPEVTPRSVTVVDVESLYGDFCKIEVLLVSTANLNVKVFGKRLVKLRNILLTDKSQV